MTRLPLMCLIVLFAVLMLQPTFAADSDEYAFILKARSSPFWAILSQGIVETAKAHGITPLIFQTDSDTTSDEQLNICQTVIERHPKIIVMGAETKSVGLECYKQATAAGIKVADFDSNVTVADAKAAEIDLAFSVGSDNYAIGQKAAEVAAGLSAKADPHIVILEGLTGSVISKARVDGFTDKLHQLKPDAVIVGSIAADWDRMKGFTITTDMLQRDPGIDIIYAATDPTGLGAVEALKTADKLDRIKVVSVDGIADARTAIAKGEMAASVAQLPYLMGKRAVELAIDAVTTGKSGISEVTPTPVLTKQSLSDKNNPDLQYIR